MHLNEVLKIVGINRKDHGSTLPHQPLIIKTKVTGDTRYDYEKMNNFCLRVIRTHTKRQH